MPIIFEEIVGTVEPETHEPPPTPDAASRQQEPDLERLGQFMARLAERAARLMAD